VLAHVATNWGAYAPSLGVTIESREVDVDDGSRTEVGYFDITGEVEVGVDDLQRIDLTGSAADDREQAIIAALRGGGQPSLDVKEQVADQLKCSYRTVERAATAMRERGHLIIESEGFPRTTTWTLPTSPDSDATTATTTPDTPRVATEQTRIPMRNADDGGDSGDSGDTPHARTREGEEGAS
jgi:hypothetical protein